MCRKLKGVSIIALWMIFIAAFSLFMVPHVSAQGEIKTLTITPKGMPLADPGTGTVTSDPAGIDTSVGDNTEDYALGTSVELTATADAGSRFMGWFVGTTKKSSETTYTVTMNNSRNLTAKFLRTYALTTATNGGDGTGTITQTLVSGKHFGEGVYKAGSVVKLTAKPKLNSKFTNFDWTGDKTGPNSRTLKTISVAMNENIDATATFSLKATALQMPQKVKVVDAAGGTIAPRPAGPTLRVGLLGALPEIPLDSDYYNDQPDVYVEEESTQTFNTINEILCS